MLMELPATNPWSINLSQKGFQGDLADANLVSGTGHGAWGKGIMTFHLGVGEVGPGSIQKVNSTSG